MKNASQLTEGALTLAIYVVLLLVSIYIPAIGLLTSLFLMTPFIFVAVKNERKFVLIFFIAAVILSLIVGTILAIPITIANGTVGIVVGYLIKKQKSELFIYTASSFTLLINLVVQYIFAVLFFKINFIAEMQQLVEQSITMSTQILQSIGQTPNEVIINQLEESVKMLEVISPSLLVVGTFMSMFVLLLVNRPILKRLGVLLPKQEKPLYVYSFPKSVLWYYLITLIITWIVKPEQGQTSFIVLTNLSFMLQMIMLVQGFLFIFYFCYTRGYSKVVPIVITGICLLMPFLLQIIIILGIIDVGFNLKQFITNKDITHRK